MFTVRKEFKFEASHILPHHDGKCQRLHGHSWKMFVEVMGRQLQDEGPKRGMVLDFSSLKEIVNPLVEEKLDHYHLNDTTGLENPTSEALCKWVFDQIKPHLEFITAVSIEETCTSWAEYRP